MPSFKHGKNLSRLSARARFSVTAEPGRLAAKITWRIFVSDVVEQLDLSAIESV